MGRGSRAVALLIVLLVAATPPARAGQREELDRGVAQVRSGQYAVAAATLRAVLEDDPGNREARLWLARALGFASDFAAAEAEYRTVLTAAPDDVEARLGLADVVAWQEGYVESEALLAELAGERPGDPEVWWRRGRVAEWSGRTEEARAHYERALSLDPDNQEARRGLDRLDARVAREYRREAEFGVAYLWIRRTSPGSQAHVAIRDGRIAGWQWFGRADYLHRFGRDEGRGTAGVTRFWKGGGSLRLEGGLSPGAEVFSRASLEAEVAWPLASGLVGYGAGKYAHYSVADAWNAVAALEWYVRGDNALFFRYILTSTEFDSGGSSTDGAWMIKLLHFRTDDDRLWAYYAEGTEGYTTSTVDQIGNISSSTFGLGGRTFPVPRWGIEANADWQEREGGNDYFTLSTLLVRRF